jgi:hypothetical protein
VKAEIREGDEVVDREGMSFIVGPIDINEMVALKSLDGKRTIYVGLISLQRGYTKKKESKVHQEKQKPLKKKKTIEK